MRPLCLLPLFLAAACATTGPQTSGGASAAAARVRALEDEYVRERFRRMPEAATRSGWPEADHAAVSDVSPEAVAAWHRAEDAMLERARALAPAVAEGSREAVTLGLVLEALEGSVAARPCRGELWTVSSISGWPGLFASLGETQPVGTPALADAARARLHRLAGRIDQEIANLRQGVALGFVATRENVERSLGEVDRLLAMPSPAWPFTRPGARAGDAALAGELAAIVEGEVRPATARYRAYLADEYLAHARPTPSLLALPDGAACYRGAVRRAVTLDLAPEAIHQTGLERMAELEAEMRRIALERFETGDVAGLLRRLREDPAFRFKDKAEVLAVTQAAVERAQAAAPRWFGRVPRAPVRVEEYPEFRRASNPAESYTVDYSTGALRGIYFINAFDPAHKPRAAVESTAFHEAVPGHHFQIALAQEKGDVSPIAKYLFNSGFAEGWVLYAEHLAGEVGLFSSDVYRLGGLSSEAFRAARLVVDTGLNVLGWSRQRAIDYLVEKAGLDPAFAASEVDRYVAWPGQATAYMLGELEIQRLRGEAEQALGPRFRLAAFHDAVLEQGSITLPMLRRRIARFVVEAEASDRPPAARSDNPAP